MKITEVNVFPVNEDRLKAYVSITIDDCFVIRDLKVNRGNQGLFVPPKVSWLLLQSIVRQSHESLESEEIVLHKAI